MTDESMTEELLKTKIITYLCNDFEIMQEVKGKHLIENNGVVIDFLIHPKPHVIENGFDNAWVGIEVKYFRDPKSQPGKIARLLWQSITYQQSTFLINNSNIRPQFVLMASNIFIDNLTDQELNKNYSAIMQVANLAMVGSLEVYDANNWRMFFVSHGYMKKTNGIFHRTKSGVGNGLYVGNSSDKKKSKLNAL